MKKTKHQAIFIRGGETFDNNDQFYAYLKKREYDPYKKWRRWTDWLEWSLSERFDSFTPLMPNKQWADYIAWGIWFEKLFPYINLNPKNKLVLIGQSLGASFLVKYLSENKMPKKIDQLHLVSVFCQNDGLIGEKIGNFEPDFNKIPQIQKQTKKIFMYHSKDDDLVPFKNSLLVKKYLPSADFFEFDRRGHFAQPAFIELLENINKNF